MIEVEIKRIKTKYESFRLKDKIKEKYLLASILKNGVKKPLSCVNQDKDYILLDGFITASLRIMIMIWPAA